MSILFAFYDFFVKIKNICFPATCYGCGKYVDNLGLCDTCWKKINWIGQPACAICGKPFEFEKDSICKDCFRKKPFFDKAVAVFEYNDDSKSIVLKFKNGDATFLGEKLARWMVRAGGSLIENVDVIIPVPTSFWKRFKRKYNQAEILANYISEFSGKDYEPRILSKKTTRRPQEGLNRAARIRNVKNVFFVKEKFAQKINQKKVLIIDDVLTTGSTVNECAKVLKKACAAQVYVLTIARVIK